MVINIFVDMKKIYVYKQVILLNQLGIKIKIIYYLIHLLIQNHGTHQKI